MTITEPPLTEISATADELVVPSPVPSRADTGPPPPPEIVPSEQPGRWSLRRVSVHGWITVAIGMLTTILYSWNLSINGMANDYYAAAVKAGSVSWKAMFFGSIDAGGFITVDKPPAALWVQSLSARIFGFSSWSMLLPEVLMGVASVLILHRLVRRWAGDVAAHIAALAFALTPVAVLMFRFNNPDAFLTFFGLASALALWKAIESGKTRYLVLSGALVGMAFNGKMLQAFLILPAFILVYLVAGKPSFLRRIGQLFAAFVAVVISSSWWVAIVALWPAASRPYIGSTSDNSIISLVFGYNGFARLFGGGQGGGPGGGGGGNAGFGGTVGWFRMFNTANAGQISWLIPLALAGLLGGLWLTRRNRRTDLHRAGFLLWGGWAAVCYIVFSKSEGTFHPYYSVQLAPAIAALAGAGSVALWQLGRRNTWLRWVLPASIAATAAWAVALLQLTPTYNAWLRPVIIGGAVLAVLGLWLGSRFRQRGLVLAAAVVAALTLLAGPTAYALTTVNTAATGSIVAAGATVSGGGGMGGGGMGGMGGGTTDTALVDFLEANQGSATYLVAAFGSMSSSPIIVATDQPVMTIGGFNGGDPAPTLAQFQQMVADGEVRYVLVGGMGGGMGGGPGGAGTTSQISSWVTSNGTAVDAGTYGGSGNGGTLYDLSGVS